MRWTIERAFGIKGIALHSGEKTHVRVSSSRCGGITFRTTKGVVQAHPSHVVSTDHSTVLEHAGARIGTVEHLMAAAWCAGVDCLDVEVEGDELPILDGSALPWLEALNAAGRTHCEDMLPVVLQKAVVVNLGNSKAIALPCDKFRLTVETRYAWPGVCSGTLQLPDKDMRQWAGHHLAPARTFVPASQVDALRQRGLAMGGSLENALVLDASGNALNPEGMRFPDEPLRHKALDALGDLALMGNLQADIALLLPGHGLTTALGMAVCRSAQAW